MPSTPRPANAPRAKHDPRLDWTAIRAVAERLVLAGHSTPVADREPVTVKELTLIHGVSERTVYRWLDALEEAGWDVIRRRDDGRKTLAVDKRPDFKLPE